MLIEIKHNNKDKIEEYIKLNSLFIREYYLPVIKENDIPTFEIFNNIQTIANEIKEKSHRYYLINFNNEIAGALLLENGNIPCIYQIFILKKYRKQKLSYKIINELEEILKKENINQIKLSLLESKNKLAKIVDKWGFKKTETSARYIGNNIYLYENIYSL